MSMQKITHLRNKYLFINSYWLCSGIPPQLRSTSVINSRRKSQIVDSLTENETASPSSKGSRQETVKENTDQLILEVGRTQKKKGRFHFCSQMFINSIMKLIETRSKMKSGKKKQHYPIDGKWRRKMQQETGIGNEYDDILQSQ